MIVHSSALHFVYVGTSGLTRPYTKDNIILQQTQFYQFLNVKLILVCLLYTIVWKYPNKERIIKYFKNTVKIVNVNDEFALKWIIEWLFLDWLDRIQLNNVSAFCSEISTLNTDYRNPEGIGDSDPPCNANQLKNFRT